MFNRRQLRRALAPTADLGGSIAAAAFGFVVLLSGVVLSFRAVVYPGLEGFKNGWFSLVRSLGVES